MNKELIAQELEALKTPEGVIHTQDVVNFAKSHPKSESHKHFNWNVHEAANAYWLQQARYLITMCTVVVMEIDDGPTEIRAWFRESKSENNQEERATGYRSTEEMLKDAAERRKIVTTTVQRALGILNSYPLRELEPLIRLANRILDKLN